MTSVAAPVFSDAEALPLAISIAMPTRQVDAAVLTDVTGELLAAARALSTELGHSGT